MSELLGNQDHSRYFECLVCGCDSHHDKFGNWALEEDVCTPCIKRLAQSIVVAGSGEKSPIFLAEGEDLQIRPRDISTRKKIPARIRKRVFEQDAYRCVSCSSYKDLVIDHIHPVAKGGSNNIENLQTLCSHCNSLKGVKTAEEWKGDQR